MSYALAVLRYPSFDPVVVRLGFLALRWYGLAYLLGFALAFAALRRMSRRRTLFLPVAAVADLVSWLALGVIVGGRTGWWLFYHRAGGAPEPWYEPVAIWHGGMSFHGGLLGVVATLALWSWRRRASFWNLADGLALVAPLGLFFGRLANFVNAELVGRPTGVAWGMVFPGDSVPRHPSQLYEAVLEGPLLSLVVWAATGSRRAASGYPASTFLAAYGLIRFVVEFTREPDPQVGFVAFGWLTMGQTLSAALVLSGAVLAANLRAGARRESRSGAAEPPVPPADP